MDARTGERPSIARSSDRLSRPPGYKCPLCRAVSVEKTIETPNGTIGIHVATCACEPEVHREREERKRRDGEKFRRALSLAGLPRRFVRMIEEKEIERSKVAEPARKMAAAPGSRGGLVMLGDPGVCKTFSGCYVLYRWIKEGIHNVHYVSIPEIASRKDRHEVAVSLSTAGLVQLDDFGYCRSDPLTATWLFALIDGIYRNEVPVIVTTSKKRSELESSIGDTATMKAIFDRLDSYNWARFSETESSRIAETKPRGEKDATEKNRDEDSTEEGDSSTEETGA